MGRLPPVTTNDEVRWQAVVARDATADGSFVFAVRTTGVYCRPSCGSRRANRRNVAFFADGAAARAAGFRACKRCRPDAAHGDAELRTRVVAQVCAWIEAAETTPKLADLAARAGYSPFHLHRMFRSVLGATPRAYAEERRAMRLRAALAAGSTVTAAMHAAGLSSTSRLHAATERSLGMAPSRMQKGGQGLAIAFAVVRCELGLALVAATDRGVCALLLGDDAAALQADLRHRFPRAVIAPGDGAFVRKVATVVACVDGRRADPGLPLDVRGTAFQQRVWAALRAIPSGRTASYTEIATALGLPRSARAVAKACGDNPLAVVVPCHRVVRADGTLAGYRWGLERKRVLLEREHPPR
ncbi:MAG: bifunctional DNA-binding transcriptional regulator/O6-methylguanine-DNA methyltransferase Ada [Planctomycetes bacterium]|nr:bifunctional DNA-binding transcriptional regulator/O6-methylguanine-DNA methyltransferase Ada [Planctomycetota bacterium]